MTKSDGNAGQTIQTTEPSEPGPVASEKTRPLRVVVCVPVEGHCEIGFTWALARATAHFAALPYEGEKEIQIAMVEGSILPEMRRRLVSQAMSINATHILWLDSDMKFPPDVIARLLNHDVAVVAANYPRKNVEARPTAYLSSKEYTGPIWTTENSEGLQQVTVAGMGVMLTDMRIFDAIPLPFFQFTPQPPDYVRDQGEDVFFCKALHDAGIPVHIDHDLSKHVAHIGKFEYTNFLAKESEAVKQALYRDLPA